MSLGQWLDALGGELETAAGRRPRRRPGRSRKARRLAVAAAVITVAGTGAALVVNRTPPETQVPAAPAVRTVAPDEILGKNDPYMGVACPEPNSIECDRVGLAVWLAQPARSVSAEIGGRAFALDDDEWSGHAGDDHRSAFAGFLQPAGLGDGDGPLRVRPDAGGRWLGGEPVSARVTLTITLGNGEVVRTAVDVPLAAGWG